MRMSALSSDVPVVPWVAYKNDTNMSPFNWVKPMANTDYYQEHILHLAMHNPPSFLYFNPCWAGMSMTCVTAIAVRIAAGIGLTEK